MKNLERYSLWFLFLVSPFVSTYLALKHNKHRFSKNILWAFIVFYGFTFAISAESSSSDINSYIAELQWLHNRTFTFSEAINYFINSGEIDVLRIFLSMLISRFTGSQIALTTVYAFIFGFFYSRNLFFITENLTGKWRKGIALLIIVFSLIIPIWNINGFRMWTAAHVFLFGLLPYLYFGKKRSIGICLLSLAIHFSFLLPVFILLVYILVGNRIDVFFFIFILTMLFSELNINWVNENFEKYLPKIFIDRTVAYRTESKVLLYRDPTESNVVWYAAWYIKGLGYAIKSLLIYLYIRYRGLIKSSLLLNAFAFSLLFFCIANLSASFPSGGRFVIIAYLISMPFIIFCIQYFGFNRFGNYLFYLTIPAFLLFIIVAIRTGFYTISATTIFGNPIIALITMGNNIAINDIIK